MTENDIYKMLVKELPCVHWTKIENASGIGMFDVNGCFKSVEFWIELKVTESGCPLIRNSQYAWGNRRHRSGGKVFLLSYHSRQELLYLYEAPFVVDEDKLYGETTVDFKQTAVKHPLRSNPSAVFGKPWDFTKLLTEITK